MKKCLLIMLSILLLASFMVTPAIAAGDTDTVTATVSATDAVGESGETVYITVSLENFAPTKAMSVTKYPDNVVVDIQNSKWVANTTQFPLQKVNEIGAVWAVEKAEDFNGEVFKLAVVVPDCTGVSNEVQLNFTMKVSDSDGKLKEYPVTATLTIKNPATGITMNTSAVALDLSGVKTATLTANVTPADTTDTVVWTSDNTAVATVANGTVTAVGEGTANITATAGSVSATCKVTVGCTHANKRPVAAKDPSCQATGNNFYYTCGDCGKVLDAQLNATTVEAQTLAILPCSGGTATCLDKPICSMCGNVYGEKLPHIMTKHDAVKATCTSTGKYAYWTCSNSVCGANVFYKDANGSGTYTAAELVEPKDAENHVNALTFVAKKDATCSETGNIAYWHCSDGCGKYFSVKEGTISKELTTQQIILQTNNNHNMTHHPAQKATCTSKGKYEYWTCSNSRCGANVFYKDANGSGTYTAAELVEPKDAQNHVKALTFVAKKDATCSETGNVAYWHCSDGCGKYFSVKEGTPAKEIAADKITLPMDPTNHKQLIGHNAVAGTCEKEGNVAYWICSGSNCQGINYGDNKGLTKLDTIIDPINPNNHVGSTYHAPKVATCVVTGNVEYWTCTNTNCAGKYFSDSACTVALTDYVTAINPDNHIGGIVQKNYKVENCYKPGYTGDTHCGSCDALLKTGKVTDPTGNHVAGSAWHTDANNHWHICTTAGCGTQVVKAAHTFQWKVDKAATEDESGLKHEECACGYKRNEGTVIEKLDHMHVGISHHAAVKATCTKAGTVEYWTCSSNKCTGKYYGDKDCQLVLETIVEAINPGNHVGKTEVKDAVEATCAKDGYTGDTYCVDCKAMVKKGEKIYASGNHTAKDGYLTNEKSHWQECSVCGQVINFAKAEHTFTWITDKNATEYAEGEKHEECTVCKYKRNEKTVIKKLPHVPSLVVGTPATCTEEGLAEHFYCYNCGQYYESNDGKVGRQITKTDTVLAATGHAYGDEWMCNGEYHWKECECGEISNKAAHETELIGAVEASEVREGYTGDTVCSACDYVVNTGETIPMIEIQPSTEAPTEDATEPATEEESSGFGGILAVTGGGLGLLILILLLLKKRKKNV